MGNLNYIYSRRLLYNQDRIKVMKIDVKGVRSLSKEKQGAKLVGATILTGANSSGKSSYVLGLTILSKFLQSRSSLLGRELMHKLIDTKDLGPYFNTSNISNGKSIKIAIEINRPIGLKLNLEFDALGESSYYLSKLELVLGELVLSDRSSCVFEKDADLYSYTIPIWNSFKMLASAEENLTFNSDEAASVKSKPTLQGWLTNVCKLNRASYSSELFTNEMYLKALREYLVKMVESEVYSDKIISAISGYLKLFNGRNTPSYIQELYTCQDFGMLEGSASSDRENLLNCLRSMLATLADNQVIVEHLINFEKCEMVTKSLGFADSGNSFDYKQAVISPDSPLVLVTEFLSEYWDTVIEYCLQSTKLSVFDKLSIQQKTFFTAEDKGIFKSLGNFEKFLAENKAVKELYMKKLFKSLIGLGNELKIESLLNGEIKTINIRKGKNSDLNISNLGTGHFYLVIMYLKLLETLQIQQRINWDEMKVFKEIGSDESKILVLVEPESFLHPNAQVQLANLISYFVSRGLRIIIETHSEHFIRALQLSVAHGKIAKEKLSIYYFENDLGTLIRPIRVDANGFLLDKFGEGFIDETPRLIQEFFKANRN